MISAHKLLGTIAGVCTLFSTVAFGYTDHAGLVRRDEVWTAAASPHVLRSTTIIPPGVKLTIQSGAVIAATDDAQLQINGKVDMQGTPDHRILITGLDQNQWGGLMFGEHSDGTMAYVTVATSSSILMRVISANTIRMYGDSLQYSPISDDAVGLSVEGGHVEIMGGVVISPLTELYSISLNPIRRIDPIQVVGTLPVLRNIDVQHSVAGLVKEFQLEQNYPNPFNPKTTIRYNVPWSSHVVLTVYDVSGKEVRRLVDADQGEGSYAVDFIANDLNSGLYFYRLQAGKYVDQKRMLLVK